MVTLPKVTDVRQVEAMARSAGGWRRPTACPPGRLRFEIQVETPQSILAPTGPPPWPAMIQAADGRCRPALRNLRLQRGLRDRRRLPELEHPAADHAKAVMQVAAAGTGVRLSDGSTNVLPVGDTAAVHAAWRLHARLVRRSLERGY